MTDKQRVLRFVDTIIPDDFVCGHISMTFDDDGSAFISINNPETDEKNIIEKHEDNPKIVRCKDCKHGRIYAKNLVDCELNELTKDADWYCADGERRG